MNIFDRILIVGWLTRNLWSASQAKDIQQVDRNATGENEERCGNGRNRNRNADK